MPCRILWGIFEIVSIGFSKVPVMNKVVGQQLQKAREAQSISLDQVSEAIYIKRNYLAALEKGNFGELPSAVQVRGFLRAYADYLELDSNTLLNSLVSQPTADKKETTSVKDPQKTPIITSGRETAAEIFAEIGATIASRREILGLSLLDIEEHIHIPIRYAEMIESGEFDKFPSPVQARGMLGNFVQFLEMDSSAVLTRYADALQSRLAAIQAEQQALDPNTAPIKTKRTDMENTAPKFNLPPGLKNLFTGDTLIFGIVGIALVGFVIWGIGSVLGTISGEAPEPTAPSLVEVLLPTATIAPTATLLPNLTATAPTLDGEPGNGDAQPTQEITVPAFDQEQVQIFIIIRQRAYLRVIVDGEIEFEGRAQPGSNLPFGGTEKIEVLTGNAAALQIFYNDQDLGLLGIFGQVMNIIYTPDGPLIPTPTITPTPKGGDNTQTPTITPQPTSTSDGGI
ncbi:MAG: DUF4115 domain-containing protein [Chloroflexota bacterium]